MAKIIITADDFGYTKLFNEMILELIKESSISSTSIMVDEIDDSQKEQVEELIDLSNKKLVSVGLHIYFKNANFQEEIERQYQKFLNIFGFKPSHIDIHKIDYLKDGYPYIQEFCRERKIPCKNLGKYKEVKMDLSGKLITTKSPSFDGTKKEFSEIDKWLKSSNNDLNVIVFHPGYYDPDCSSSLNKEREMDAENARKIKKILSKYQIELVNFNDLKVLE